MTKISLDQRLYGYPNLRIVQPFSDPGTPVFSGNENPSLPVPGTYDPGWHACCGLAFYPADSVSFSQTTLPAIRVFSGSSHWFPILMVPLESPKVPLPAASCIKSNPLRILPPLSRSGVQAPILLPAFGYTA